MAVGHAYAPSLSVTPRATLRKERRLPIAGQVLAALGAAVRAEDVVAHAELPGDVSTVNVVNQLGVSPAELPRYMLKQQGAKVQKDEIIAATKPFIKFFRSIARSPADGTIETVSHVTGQVIIRSAPRPVDVRAYVDGTVVEVWQGEGVCVETTGAFVQGILGIGGEVAGEIAMVGDGPAAIIGPNDITAQLRGKIVVAGALVTREVFDKATQVGVAALVCGGFHDADLRALLGYDLGVAITGHEDIHPTLIITEGFGTIAMARGTRELLASHAGRRASANGATQIRAGVLRPEIIIPLAAGAGQAARADAPASSGLTVGCAVRIIREPGFGRLGKVKSLPPEARRVESEAKVRVVELQFAEGETMIVPRTNVEVIGS
ncbi:MAG: hypothetical protein ACE15C_16150 [Phycisphaerae bacterium]